MRRISLFSRHLLSRFRRNKTHAPYDLYTLDPETPLNHRPVFAVGTGRSGTHFFQALMARDPGFLSFHLDSLDVAIADSFIQYGKWYQLEMDYEPFLLFRRRLMVKASHMNKIYFESNPYLSLMARTLYTKYNARLLLLIRNPKDTINSHYVKGWYDSLPERSDVNRVPVIPPDMRVNHFFGRIMPIGADYESWEKLSRVGKIAWWWNALNLNVYRQLKEIPSDCWKIVTLDTFDYHAYRHLHGFLGGRKLLEEQSFEKLRCQRPGKGKKRRTAADWSDRETREYLIQTEEAREVFHFDE